MLSRPKVVICLATYNGEAYLREQLESIINQQNVDIQILAGDDGSTDKTLDILNQYLKLGKIANIYQFGRVGISNNFINLLKYCKDYDFVAFSDQDDVWESNKLFELSNILGSEKPELSFCQRSISDSARNKHKPNFPRENRVGFRNALVENVVPGNTMMLNRKAVEVIISSNASFAKHYDSYIYLLISGIGEIKYLPAQLVNYRIHENNAVGLGKAGITNFTNSVNNYVLNAQLLESKYSDSLDTDKLKLLNKFLMGFKDKNWIKSIYNLLTVRTRRQSTLDELVWRVIAILVRLRNDPD